MKNNGERTTFIKRMNEKGREIDAISGHDIYKAVLSPWEKEGNQIMVGKRGLTIWTFFPYVTLQNP